MTNSSGAQKLTLTQIVDKATDELLIGPDWSANLQFCDILNTNPVVANEAIKLIMKKVKDSKSVHVQILALELLTTVVKNCFCSNSIVASKDFHSTITKLLEKKKLNENVRFKLTDMVQSFALSFKNTEWRNQFDNLYSSLRRQGISFPPPGNESVFSPPPPPGYNQRYTTDHPQRLPNPTPVTSISKPVAKNVSRDTFNSAREAAQLLSEILSNVETKEELKENDIATEIYEGCKDHQKKVLQVLEGGDVTDETQLEDLLQLNDQLVRVVSRYDAALKGEIYKPALLAAPREPLLEFFNDDSPRNKTQDSTTQVSHPTTQVSQPTTQVTQTTTNSFFDDFISQPTAPTHNPPTTTTNNTHVPLLSAPPASVKSRTIKKGSSLTGQSAENLQNQLHNLFLNDDQKPPESDPFMQIAMRHNNIPPTANNGNPFGPVTTNPNPGTTNPQFPPTNPQFPNTAPQFPPANPQTNPQFPNTKPTGPFANPPPLNSFPGPLPAYNPQLMPPPNGMPFYPPQQPFPTNFPTGPVYPPYQYGGPAPNMPFPPPPQFYYAPPTGMHPVNPNMGTQQPNNSPNKPF